MRRRFLSLAICCTVALASCGGREQAASPRTKNAALPQPALINANFSANGGGWSGDGFTLDRGCAANSTAAVRPSLGAWVPNALVFGRNTAAVRQEVVIPNPTVVTFDITGNVRADDSSAWFKIDLSDADESVSTDRQSGSTNIAPKSFTLTVTTTSPNEKVQIVISGSGKQRWAGCYGPILRSPSLSVRAMTPTATTTTTVRATTTTSTTVTPTTTIPPAPPCAADGRCAVGNRGPGTGLVYLVDTNQPASYNRYFELAPRGWNGGSANDPVLTVDNALREVAKGITTQDGTVIPSPWYSASELDWRAPTKSELQAVYDSKVDRSMTGEYLSITRASLQEMIYSYLNFDTGTWRNAPASSAAKVRPVRRGPSPCALGGPCKIGDTGPMGGKIFYATTKLTPIATSKQPCTTDWNPCLYMELAPSGWSGAATDPLRQWANPKGCCQQIADGAAAGTAIGTGAKNTDAILVQQQSYDSAAKAAFTGNGAVSDYGKWFLPSNDEMREVCRNKRVVGAPTEGLYWTSSENMQNAAFTVDFSNCDISGMSYKDGLGQHSGRLVRPARAFAPACVPGIATVDRNSGDITKQLTTDPCLNLTK